ncbi:MAG TPA: hypothetical protein VK421_20300 [Pyrinomonadaceae bacterium]|nr:hypothetical protein [Pyrinomonadaceae bacterium]
MSEETPAPETPAGARDLDGAQARLAYSIIESLLEHTRVTGDLVALMARALGSDVLEALTATPHWAAYLDSRRALERTREQIEQFTEIMNALGGDEEVSGKR